jgi:hypothetical protein
VGRFCGRRNENIGNNIKTNLGKTMQLFTNLLIPKKVNFHSKDGLTITADFFEAKKQKAQSFLSFLKARGSTV